MNPTWCAARAAASLRCWSDMFFASPLVALSIFMTCSKLSLWLPSTSASAASCAPSFFSAWSSISLFTVFMLSARSAAALPRALASASRTLLSPGESSSARSRSLITMQGNHTMQVRIAGMRVLILYQSYFDKYKLCAWLVVPIVFQAHAASFDWPHCPSKQSGLRRLLLLLLLTTTIWSKSPHDPVYFKYAAIFIFFECFHHNTRFYINEG